MPRPRTRDKTERELKDAKWRQRVIRWAELLLHLRRARKLIERAQADNVVDDWRASNAIESLECVIADIGDGGPPTME